MWYLFFLLSDWPCPLQPTSYQGACTDAQKCSCHFVPAPPQRQTSEKGIMLRSLLDNKNRHWPGSSFCQFQLCNGSCWLHLDKTAVTLRARRDPQSSGIKLQHPNRGSFRSSDGNQKLLKGSAGLPETQTHMLGYCCSSQTAYWSLNCYAVHHVSNAVLKLCSENKRKNISHMNTVYTLEGIHCPSQLDLIYEYIHTPLQAWWG